MKRGISGFVCVRDAVLLDYSIREAVCSLIPCCTEVVVSDGESSDDTRAIVESIGDSRVRIVTYPWPNPKRDIHFLTNWLNWTRERLTYDYQVTIDADEIMSESAYPVIARLAEKRECGLFKRLNFWKNAQHLAPLNTVCGDYVARCGPSNLYVPSDEPNVRVNPNLRTDAEHHEGLTIFHCGFLRDPKKFLAKSEAVQEMFFGQCDPRLMEFKQSGGDWRERDYFDGAALERFDGRWPVVARDWLEQRGYLWT
jgi:glycosyltransferase involved in cell wall biosynthesis